MTGRVRRGLFAALLGACLTALTACTGVPENITPVADFRVDRYLGRWYEIARLDHSFERGLTQVTAEYSMRPDGGVKVVNRGYSQADKAWKEVEGKAFFVGPADRGHLKVSFFGPFYGSYVVFELDRENYQHAVISGPTRSYLWILARRPEIDPALRARLVDKATQLGFDTKQLVFVEHGP